MEILAAAHAVDKHPHEYPTAMPEALRLIVPRTKAALQWPHFPCPSWASLCPNGNAHLEESKLGLVTRVTKLARYPYYLIGSDRIVCDVHLQHRSISRVHAAIVYHGEKQTFMIVDLSTNGVKVGGTRIPRNEAVPLPFGSVMQFANSHRSLTLRRESPSKVDAATGIAVAASRGTIKHDGSVTASAPSQTKPEPEVPKPLVPPPKLSRPFRHLVIKHYQSSKPVSGAPRNRGEPITRSAADAWCVAHAIRRKLVEDGEEVSEDRIIQAVADFSECTTAKKGGDLGVVTQGTMNGAWEAAAFALAPSELSLPVETDVGVHLIYRVNRDVVESK